MLQSSKKFDNDFVMCQMKAIEQFPHMVDLPYFALK